MRFAEGTFFIESTGENGVAMNSPSAMLPQLERRALKNGDRLFIDDLEIQVLLADSPMSLAIGDDALGRRPAHWAAARHGVHSAHPVPRSTRC